MFVIAGATGNTGSVVAGTLLGQGKSVTVLVRDTRKAESWREKGAHVAAASLEDTQASMDFAQSFTDQWLRVRDLGQAFEPDPKLFPEWRDSELQGDIRNQPFLFFREILVNHLSILDFLDSNWTIATTCRAATRNRVYPDQRRRWGQRRLHRAA